MSSARAPAKINLALVVGPTRADGFHEVATILQRVDLCDAVSVEAADELAVDGFAGDTIVRRALEAIAAAAGVEPRWRAHIEKRIPVASGLGGGSSDAATALRLANGLLGEPLSREHLHALARQLGADVPFFLEPGPQLGTGDGTTLEPLELPKSYAVLLLLPHGASKHSTGAIYGRFDSEAGFDERRRSVLEVAAAGSEADLASLPANDLVTSPHSNALRALGAFRADVSGAGPTLSGLFDTRAGAERAAAEVSALGETWVVAPAWYV
jgi:4-diphosphocytidyl-2-C-methyl-D-erythritol kinase